MLGYTRLAKSIAALVFGLWDTVQCKEAQCPLQTCFEIYQLICTPWTERLQPVQSNVAQHVALRVVLRQLG